ncbi:MAG: carboxypeptidase regulatory-like domain-containing protein [Vicinamibacterales bacterium]
MRTNTLYVFAAILLAGCLSGLIARVDAQGGAALAGTVSSQEEGNMEGVLVTARREGAAVDVTVVSDAQGRYAFPRTHLKDAGTYAIKIRAVGFDLAMTPATVSVDAGKTATLDLKLQAAKDISSQVTSVEWITSVPGTPAEKALVIKQIASCTYCHSLERVLKSKHTAEQFVPVIHRMQKYYPDGTIAGTEGRGRAQFDNKAAQAAAEKNPMWGYVPGANKVELSKYLATINQSGGRPLPAKFNLLPRPKGKGTKVIITQYDMPRKDTVAHDMDVALDGNPWYTDQSRPFIGTMNARTGQFTEYPIRPLAKDTHHEFAGASDIQMDREGNAWFPTVDDSVNNHFGLIHKFDPKTKIFTPTTGYSTSPVTQFMSIGPDGKIWSGFATFYRIDPKTAKVDWEFDWTKAPNVPKGPHSGYEIAVDPKGNPWITDFSASAIVGVDVKTKTVKFFPTPTPNAQPRRGKIDAQGRYWFGEYTGDKIGMFDTNTGKFIEYDPKIPFAAPYTASTPDKDGRVYAPSNTADRLFRVDSKTGEIVTYLMPVKDFDTKQVTIDPLDKRTVWFANERNARIVKVEPLD